MKKIDRRSALAIGLAASSAAMVKPAASQTTDPLAGKDTSPGPGVVQRAYGEEHSMVPGFKTVAMRDIIVQPGAKTGDNTMPLWSAHRRGASRGARRQDHYGQKELRLDLQ